MTVLSFYQIGSKCIVAFGVVHQLIPSLNITDRTHGCPSELLTLTCNATGRRVEWNISDANISITFDVGHDVNTVMTRGTGSHVSALLLNIQEASGQVSKMNFFTIIFIDVAEAVIKKTLPSTIICSTNETENDTFYSSVAGKHNVFNNLMLL